MIRLFSCVLCVSASTLFCSFSSAETEHPYSSPLIWTLEDSPKEIRDPPLTRGGSSLKTFANVELIEKDGQAIGYKITPTEKGQPLFDKYGLLSGDIITKINEIRIVNQDNAIRALRKLVKATSIDLEVIRNGSKIKFSISLD